MVYTHTRRTEEALTKNRCVFLGGGSCGNSGGCPLVPLPLYPFCAGREQKKDRGIEGEKTIEGRDKECCHDFIRQSGDMMRMKKDKRRIKCDEMSFSRCL